jgi:hypothetical protein
MPDSTQQADAQARCILIRKQDYSAGPWRLVDSHSGFEVPVIGTFDDPEFGEIPIHTGCATKSEAIHHLGELAASALPAPRDVLDDPQVIAAQVRRAGLALGDLLGNPHAPLDRSVRQRLREEHDVLANVYRRLCRQEKRTP